MKLERLRLYEEVTLLALSDDKGTFASNPAFSCALAGALTAELLLEGRITVEETKKKIVRFVGGTPLGDPLLDEGLARIAAAKRDASLSTWVGRLAGIRKLPHRAALGLCRKGILREETSKVLLVFDRALYPTADPRPERAIRERLRRALLSDTSDVDARTVTLLALARGGSLLSSVLDKREMKERKKRIESLVAGEGVGASVKEATDAMNAALAAVFVATTLAVTVSD